MLYVCTNITLQQQTLGLLTLTLWLTSMKLVYCQPLAETDAISDWTLTVFAGFLSRRISSWLMDVRTVSHSAGFFWCGHWKYVFTSEQNDTNVTRWILFQQLFRMAESCAAVRFLSSGAWQFLSTNISQGSVATRLRRGRMFSYRSVRNLPLSLPKEEFRKSVGIWQS